MLNVLKTIDHSRFQYDVIVESSVNYALNKEFRESGGQVLIGAKPLQPIRFVLSFFNILRQHGPYDIVHSHLGNTSGLILLLAWIAGIPIRIAHLHSSAHDTSVPFLWRVILRLSKAIVGLVSTAGIGISKEATAFLFGQRWNKDSRYRVVHCGIDMKSFGGVTQLGSARAALGIPSTTPVVGHIGRFHPVKNHRFLMQLALRLLDSLPDTRFLLLGDGQLKQSIERLARNLGISDNIVFLGERSDVPFLLEAMDCFVLPSIREGIPLSFLEAQASGLPCVISDVVSTEADVIPSLITRLSLSSSLESWSEAVRSALQAKKMPLEKAVSSLRKSDFSIQASVESLVKIYIQEIAALG